MPLLPFRPDLTATDWLVVQRIYRKVFHDGRDPNRLRATWKFWLWLLVAGVLGLLSTTVPDWPARIASIVVLLVVARVCWRTAHEDGYYSGFDEGFERGTLGAHGIEWQREDLYDDELRDRGFHSPTRLSRPESGR